MTRRQLLRQTTIREREEWAVYASIEPFGEIRADLRAGIITSMIANVNRGKKTPPFKPIDFMPYAKPDRKKVVADKISAALRAKQKRGN
jgi:hypothetical protein